MTGERGGERQGLPHDESIMDPEKAHYVANVQKEAKDKEVLNRHLIAIMKRVDDCVSGIKSSKETSEYQGAMAELAYDLAKKYSEDILQNAYLSYPDEEQYRVQQVILKNAIELAEKKRSIEPEVTPGE